jgi:phytanoyl-CoA hydroxylase
MTADFHKPAKPRFLAEGFVVLRNVLDPETDLSPLAGAWSNLLDRLATGFLGSKLNEICPTRGKLDFPNRFATLVGAANGGIFDHIDPALNVFESGYRRWRNVSSAQIPELFDLIRNPRILDVVESLIGPEISATPLYHLNIKLGTAHLRQLHMVSEHANVGKGSTVDKIMVCSRFPRA